MKALVTGGGGFLGLYIVEQLRERGDDVRVFSRGEYSRLAELDVVCVRGDIRDADAVAEAVRGSDAVFHVAAVPGIWGPWERYHEINTLGTEHVINACRRHGVPKLVYTSSPSVIYDGKDHENADESLPYPKPDQFLTHYPHSKMLAEKSVLAANDGQSLATCALRPHLIWGPRDNHLIPRLIRRAKSGRLRRIGDGTNLISMSYVENVATAHLQAADALNFSSPVAGEAYFINEPEPVNLWKWIDELLTRAGLPPLKKKISAKKAYRVGHMCEHIYRFLRLPGEPPMTRFLASQLSGSHYYSVAKAHHDFGYQPRISIEQGMANLEPELRALAEES